MNCPHCARPLHTYQDAEGRPRYRECYDPTGGALGEPDVVLHNDAAPFVIHQVPALRGTAQEQIPETEAQFPRLERWG